MTFGRAATECHLYDAGNRFGLLFFELPLLATVMWATSLLPAFIFARRGRHAILASWFTGLLLALVIAYLYLGRLAPAVMAAGLDQIGCAGGVPEWWPSWLLRWDASLAPRGAQGSARLLSGGREQGLAAPRG
jgi:hypothetical protein